MAVHTSDTSRCQATQGSEIKKKKTDKDMLKLCKQTYVTNINITHPVDQDNPFCPR